MKKCFNAAASIGVILILALAGCPQPEPEDPFVPVANIFGVPSTATAGTPLVLTGTVEPPDATNQTIVWSVIDPGTTGAVISDGNTLNTTATGTVVVRATVANGLASGPFTKDFPPITVNYGEGTVGKLTITGLPPEVDRWVYIFSPGTDFSTYEAADAAYYDGSYLAYGGLSGSDGSFLLYPFGGSQGGGFTGDGSYLVLLQTGEGSATDMSNPRYAQATAAFSNGAATVSFGSFSAVFSTVPADIQISFTGPSNDDIAVDGSFKLSKSDSSASSISIIVYTWNHDSFRWLVDGVDLAGKTDDQITLDASNYTVGAHWLMVITKVNGVPYSREFSFVVVD